MPTEVPGQLFGYTLQYPRAYLRLLEISKDASVCIEEIGDVGILYSDGSKLAEEDKSTIRKGNPVSDKSKNLWKTFYNWINKINSRLLNVETDKFVLYVNHSVDNDSIVKKMNSASRDNVDEVIDSIQEIKSQTDVSNENYHFLDSILNANNIQLLKKLILSFDLVEDKFADNVYVAIKDKLINDLAINTNKADIIINTATGWLQQQIMHKIANGEEITISKVDYLNFIQPVYHKVLTEVLFDYACSKVISKDQVLSTLDNQPNYVKQLELIELEEESILEAINDYYKAEINRDKWNEDGVVTLSDIQNFKDDLISSYKNTKRSNDIIYNNRDEVERGKILYSDCQEKDIKLAQKQTPSRTVQGTYQLLADEKELGWHPNWKNKLK